MLLEYVSFILVLSTTTIAEVFPIGMADLRELCRAGKARILQRRDIPSDYRRASHNSMTSKLSLIIFMFRILWSRVEIRPGQAKVVPASTVKSCTCRTPMIRLGPPVVPDCTITYIHPLPQRRRDPSRAKIHRCRDPRNGQLGP